MADVSVKMGVSGISAFKQGMNEAQASVKTLDAALKANEKQFQKTGNAEEHYAAQTTLLNQKLKQQKQIIENAEKALKQMEDNGVKQSSTAYQNMQRKLIEAQSAMMDTEAALENLGSGAQNAAGKTDQLSTSLGGLNKKVSLEQVLGAINSITSGMERAAQHALDFGKQLWDSIMDSARRADDTATMAEMYGIDLDTFQRMQKLVAGGMDTSVEAILSAQDKLKKGVGKGSQDVLSYLKELHVGIRDGVLEDWTSWKQKDPAKMFWEAGQAIMAMGDAYDKEAAAQALFGKGWKELVPLFNTYHSLEEYNAALEEQTVNSEETIRDLAELNDAVGALESSWTTMKDEVMGQLAPALKGAADAISGLLDSLTEYLQTPEGKKALEDLETAVSGLFEDLGKIDPQQVISGFTDVFGGLIQGLQWLVENKGAVGDALIGIVAAWGTLEVGSGVLTILKLIDGLKDLGLIGAAGAAATGGGGSVGGGLATLVSNGLANILPGLANFISMNGGPVADWLTHESPVAGVLRGQESLGDVWTRFTEQVEENAETFTEDWSNNNIVKFFKSGIDKITQDVNNTVKAWENTIEVLTDAETWNFGDMSLDDIMQQIFGETNPEVTVEPKVDGNAAAEISESIGTVTIPVQFSYPGGYLPEFTGGAGAGGSKFGYVAYHANGIWGVPFDGYHAILHKGERVVPAREVSSRSYNSNLYVESMIMNNGTDAEGLAAAMAAAQRRTSAGFGS